MTRSVLARLNNLSLRVRPYWDLPVSTPPGNVLPQAMSILGALPDAASLQGTISAVMGFNLAEAQANFATSAGATLTISNTQGLLQRLTNGGAVTVTLDSAYNMVNVLQNPFNGQAWYWDIITNAATTVATPTLSDTAITLSGTTTMVAAAWRRYQTQITQLSTTVGSAVTAGTTFTSIAQVGTTNNFTVTLVTNAISPTVGNVIYLNVTAGTLPPGWYPINKVNSATSFVIATPPGVVWTATAATVPGTVTVPASQYTPGLQGVYSPLLTITGCMTTVTATMAV